MVSHKHLKSISHNFSHSFISLMNYINGDYILGHILRQARRTGLNTLTIDILSGAASPAGLVTKEIKDSIGYYVKWFPDLVQSSGSSMDFIKSATMIIEYDLTKEQPFQLGSDYMESPFECTMIILDDRNKEYRYTHNGWWYPEKN